MKHDWIKGTLAFFILVAFFGGYYIGASDMGISFEIDDNTLRATEHLTDVVAWVEREREMRAWHIQDIVEVKEPGIYRLQCVGYGNPSNLNVSCMLGDGLN